MSDSSDITKEELSAQLKSSVYLMVAKMVEERLKDLQTPNQNDENPISATPTFIATLVELTFNQIINLGEDLELFARHANRTTVKPNDLYMVTRKNDVLTQYLKEIEQKLTTKED
ncbi:kinetochore component CENP-S-domain-containing protein [Scheffersomyces coipomensis]|uniref:kinetochore component CENP-S-domain-containing protein n=1 Tax=Scheffersomyces coipomensis TaxID=1788519 RepID=UPI00315CD03A